MPGRPARPVESRESGGKRLPLPLPKSTAKSEQKSSKLNIHDYPLPWDRMYDKDERGEQLIHAGLPANRAVFPSGGDKRLPGLAGQYFQCKQELRKR